MPSRIFVDDAQARRDTRERLKSVPDLARALARLVVERGGPRDLAAIRDGIAEAASLASELQGHADIPAELAQVAAALCRPDPAIAAELAAALDDELPYLKRDGGFVRPGYDPALDELRALRDESRRVIAALQARYADATGVRALKVRHNNVLGYFVEVRRSARRQAVGAAAQRHVHPSPDARRPGALHDRRAGRARSQDRQRRRPRARHRDRDVRASCRAGHGSRRRDQGGGRGARGARRRDRAGAACRRPRLCAARDRRRVSISSSTAGGTPSSSRHSPATAPRLSPTSATCRRPRRRIPAASGSSPAPTWRANRPICGRTR